MKQRGWWIAIVLVLAALVAAGAAWLLRPGPVGPNPGRGLPEPGTPEYEDVVSAFYSGVAALDADASKMAVESLGRASTLVPGEAASLANLGLAHIRMGDFDAAAASLQAAHELAPTESAIEVLLAELEQRRGRYDEARKYLEQAIEHDPGGLRARYSLAQELIRQGDDAAALAALEAIRERSPANLAALLDLARLAAKLGDKPALEKVVAGLAQPSSTWPENIRAHYDSLRKALDSPNPRAATQPVIVLRNVLLKDPAFQRSIDELMLPTGTIGQPLTRFLRLKPPVSTSAAPDHELVFQAAPLAATGAQAVALLEGAEPAQQQLVAANAQQVFRADGSGVLGAFPGGEKAVAPTRGGVIAPDWSSDYRPDLVLAGAGGVRIHRQAEDGSFVDVTGGSELPAEVRDAAYHSAWAVDLDLDGDLDLVLARAEGATVALQNRGDQRFAPLPLFEAIKNLRAFAWADLDSDGDPDPAFLDDQGQLSVLENLRAGAFRPRTVPSGLPSGQALTVADVNRDGQLDLLLAGRGSVTRLSFDASDAQWQQAELVSLDQALAAVPCGALGLLAPDLDNNGANDLVVSGPDRTWIWLADPSTRFEPLAAALPIATAFGAADFNNDGWLDLAGLASDGQVVQALGKGGKPYHWQVIRPRAANTDGDKRINSFGVGGEAQARAGLLTQTQLIAGPVVHFGLGTHAQSDVIRVVWPNGTSQAEFNSQADTTLVTEQRLKGSCPFVYAFNGRSIEFVTDFLWRSPLGLRINAQDTAGVGQTEDWIKIRGDQLQPLPAPENSYDIRLTAELWETHYWDHVALLVVDHREGTQIHVDERFARTPPPLEVRMTGEPRPVAGAWDDQGADVAAIVSHRDGKYVDTFGRGAYQGVTRDHFIELDLGPASERAEPAVLVAEGWIHPTDSSINVALAQGSHEPPRGLSLEVQHADRTWTVARDDLGFPAGKNKTILVPLAGVVPADGTGRIRLRTNLEVFWDRLSVAAEVDDPDAIRTMRVEPSEAELRFRGYSVMTQADRGSPELPIYGQLQGTRQKWNDLIGRYTRFGDVRALLRSVDDRYVIANAGDEVRFLFPAPPAAEPGWTRDFVLIGDGWNKDGDYNTAYSKTVLPLPSHAQPRYDAPPGELEDDPVFRQHAADWEQFHTRSVTPRVFHEGITSSVDQSSR